MFDNIYDEIKKVNILDSLPNGAEIEQTVIPLFQITYIESSGFGVYVCENEFDYQFNIKGTFVEPLVLGQTYHIKGKVASYNSKYGLEKQIAVDKIRNTKPVNEKGIIAYLQTLKGLKKRAYDIYDVYGDKSIDVLMENPMKVAKNIKGIGKKSVLDWQKQLEKMKDNQEMMMGLLDIGLTAKQSKELYKKYGEEVLDKIEENPYLLAKEVKGFGFLTCDRIARNMGYSLKSSNRIQEGIIFILEESTNEGHCYLPYNELIEKTSELLDIRLTVQEMIEFRKKYNNDFKYEIGKKEYATVQYDEMVKSLNNYMNSSKWNKDNFRYKVFEIKEEVITKEIDLLKLQRRVIIEDNRVYLQKYYHAEERVAYHVNRIKGSEVKIQWNVENELNKYCSINDIDLEDRQKEAVIKFSQSTGGFHILNGSAGCGKTFTLKLILEMLDILYKKQNKMAKVSLMAPTGKAAKVATKATGMECKTVHRGLGYNPGLGFEHDEQNPLEEDIIIVDESSMLDIILANNLFSAVKSGTKVILLGDTKQLPSVGAGNVLSDLIDSKKIDVVTLNVVKRQGKQSGIIKNANAIIEGKMIETREDTEDAYMINVKTPMGAQKAIIMSIERLQEKGYDFADIQLLCPQKGGTIGTEYMNYLLQQTFNSKNEGIKVLNKNLALKLNPDKNEVTKLKLYFKEGDKIIHTKNNYDMLWYKKTKYGSYEPMGNSFSGITNGECGVIEEIRKGKDEEGNTINEVIVRYEDLNIGNANNSTAWIIYSDGVQEIDHAYALTIHKSQGSGFRAVIIPMMMQNYIMLDNNLFYTAYTRAEDFITTVGEDRAIKHAIKTHRSRERYTTLKEKL